MPRHQDTAPTLQSTRSLCLALFLFLGIVVALPARAETGLRVVATIKPVHGLVAAVMEDVATPDLLMDGTGATPHGFSLRPSHARKLAAADLVVWIGPGLESFLVRPLAANRTRTLPLIQTPGLHLLAGEDAHDDHDGEHKEENDGDVTAIDPHIWLAPENARRMVAAIVDALAEVDPDHAATYRNNAERLTARISQMETSLRARLTPHAKTPFAVYHDGYGYLVDAFGLNNIGAVSLSPDRLAGAAHTQALRETIRAQEARCLFSEPGVAPKRLRALGGPSVKIGILDPLGATLPPGPDHYERMMDALAGALVDCLAPSDG